MTPRLSEIWIYPIKSCRGVSVSQIQVDALGLAGDRRFLVVDERGAQLTQRTHPKMVSIVPTYTAGGLKVSIEGAGTFQVPAVSATPTTRKVAVWSDTELLAEDCGEEASARLTEFLGQTAHLVRIGRDFVRPVKSKGTRLEDRVSFADAYPLLAISTASLRELNDRLMERGEEPVPMNRFRPNFVFENAVPFEEDTWGRLKVGALTFRAGGPCGRCIMTTTDQRSGERGHEPLKTLATYRRDPARPSEINFGQNLINEAKSGEVSVGALVTTL